MSTFIGVESTVTYGTDSRAWLWGPHGTEPGTTPSIVLDISSFTAATHYPNGQIPSGTVLGKITASGLYGPYDNAATDGRQTAAGILFSFVVPKPDTTKDIADLFTNQDHRGLLLTLSPPIAGGPQYNSVLCQSNPAGCANGGNRRM